MSRQENGNSRAATLEADRSEVNEVDYKAADQIAEDLRSLRDLRGFGDFLQAGAKWDELQETDEPTYRLYSTMGQAFLGEQRRNPDEQRSVVGMVEAAIHNLDSRVTRQERNPRIVNYRDAERRVRALLDFYKAREDWHSVQASDPARFEELSSTYHNIERARTTDPAYKDKGMDFAAVAQALVERFGGKALALAQIRVEQLRPKELPLATDTAKVVRPHELFTTADLHLPNEVVQQWQILKVNKTKRTYTICRAADRRSPGDIMSDIASGRDFQGQAAGYELSWEDFEKYNQANTDSRAGAHRAESA